MRCSPLAKLLCLALSLLLFGSLPLNAARRSSSSRIRAAIQAQRNKMIAETRREIEAAKSILKSVEMKGSTTQAELARLTSQLETSARVMKGASQQDLAARKDLADVEEKILSAQADDSHYARKIDEIDGIQLELEHQFHRVLNLPENLTSSEDIERHRLLEMAKVSPEERDKLHVDRQYLAAESHLIAACNELSAIESKLFQENSEWKSANEKLQTAHKEQREKTLDARHTGAEARGTGQQLQNLQQVAAEARRIISAGEQRLHELGTK